MVNDIDNIKESSKQLEDSYNSIKKTVGNLTQEERELLSVAQQLNKVSSEISKSYELRSNKLSTIKSLYKQLATLRKEDLDGQNDINKLTNAYNDALSKARTTRLQQAKATKEQADAEEALGQKSSRVANLQNTIRLYQEGILNAQSRGDKSEVIRLQRLKSRATLLMYDAKTSEKNAKEDLKNKDKALVISTKIANSSKQQAKLLKENIDNYNKLSDLKKKEQQAIIQEIATRKTERALIALKKEARIDEILQLFTIEGIIGTIIKYALQYNKISVDIGKNFAYGAEQANRLTSNLLSASQKTNNINFTLKNAAEAMEQLNEQTGLVSEYSINTLETQILLTKQFGLTANEAAGIYRLSVLNGKSAEQINKSMVGAYVASRNQLGVGIPFKATIAEAAKVSGQLAANLKNNPEYIVKAVAQAKALGITLEQTKRQGESLLEFESSIEAELRAELLIGQALNLEKARAAALMGDQVTVMKELNNQGMTLEKFQNLNVLAQRSFASALGLSSDELANQLRQQKLAIESGKSLAQITEEEALEAQKRQSAQEKFNLAIEKLKELIGNLVAGPLGSFLEAITSILSHTTALKVVIAGLAGYMVASLIPSFSRLAVIMRYIKMQGIGTAIATAISNPFAAIAGLVTAGIVGAYLNSKTADDMISPGYGKRTILSPEGAIKLNDKDTIIAGTNLGGNPKPQQNDNSALIAAINKQTDVIASKNYNPTLQTVIEGSVIATATTQNSYKLA
jgi:hypothetical protein